MLGRPNLNLVTGVRVHRLAFDGDRVTGVEAEIDGRPASIAAGLVLLAMGAVATPLLLMRSGIGPQADLKRAGIPVRHAREAVGANLHDHLLTAGNVYRARRPVPPSKLQHSESLMYLDADDPTVAEGPPSVVLGCVAAPTTSERLAPVDYGTAFTILSGVTHPTSRGRLTVTGPHLEDAPIIDPNYLATEHDRRLVVRALELAREIGASAELDDWRAEEIHPGPAARTRDDLLAFVEEAVITHHHPVGTCAMGAAEDAVVDARLAVRGLERVHVVDASVIPSITSGPVHAAVLAIADRFADDLLAGAPA